MHWNNSNFQKLYFIIGTAHTPDEAYRQCLELLDDRFMAKNEADHGKKETALEIERLQSIVDNESEDTFVRRKAALDIEKFEVNKSTSDKCYDECLREIEFLEDIKKKIEPHRAFGLLPQHEANQLSQSDFWAHEFLFRAQNQIATRGCIEPGTLKDIRTHPAAESFLIPEVNVLMNAQRKGEVIPIAPIATTGWNGKLLQESMEVLIKHGVHSSKLIEATDAKKEIEH